AKLLGPKTNKQERMQAATMIASNVLITIAGAKLLHDSFGMGEFEFDPSKPGFGRFTTQFTDGEGKQIVWDYLPQDSVQRAFLQSIREIMEGDPKEAAEAWARAGIGSASPAMRPFLGGLGLGFDAGSGYRILEPDFQSATDRLRN